ncbi:MAG: cyclic nucleotide-binding domain-containing protein [Gallionella sp.]|nr:cyclic nucleotide-binding domain-containing protein [Gallionella sp.]
MNLAELFQHETGLLDLPSCETLFKEGDPGKVMYVLMSGTADIIVRNQVVETIEPGAIVGEMAMIDEGPRSATIIAKSDCKLLPIDKKRFDFLVQQTPNFAVHVMRVIATRLRRTDSLL